MKKGRWSKQHRDEFVRYLLTQEYTEDRAFDAYWSFVDITQYVPAENHGAEDAKYFVEYERRDCA